MKSILLTISSLLMLVLANAFNGDNLGYYELMSRCQEERCIKSREYSAILGRASWTFLHTLSVNYPDVPTVKDKTDILQFLHLFGRFYPCHVCSKNFEKELEKLPPRVDSRHEFAIWMCELHNSVNERLGKPTFDCARVFEQWQRDPADGYCPDVCPVNFDSADEDEDMNEEAHSYIAVDSVPVDV